jgi:hypothetical protein
MRTDGPWFWVLFVAYGGLLVFVLWLVSGLW